MGKNKDERCTNIVWALKTFREIKQRRRWRLSISWPKVRGSRDTYTNFFRGARYYHGFKIYANSKSLQVKVVALVYVSLTGPLKKNFPVFFCFLFFFLFVFFLYKPFLWFLNRVLHWTFFSNGIRFDVSH